MTTARAAFAVSALALFVHLLFLALLPAEARTNESADYQGFYRPLAERLIDGRGLRDGEGRVAMRYPPGFSMILAPVVATSRTLGIDEGVAIGAMVAVCVAAATYLLVLLARRLSGSLAVAALAGLGWAFYPPQLWMSKQPNSELPFLVLMLGGLLLWWRSTEESSTEKDHEPAPRRPKLQAFGGGVLLGLATLIRPIGLLMTPVMAVSALLVKREKRRAVAGAILIAGQLLAIAPWILFVRAEAGVWIPISSGGRLSLLDGLTLGVDPEEPSPPLSDRVLALTHDVQAHRAEIRGPASAARFLLGRALEDPLPVIELMALKAARSWYGTESVRHEKWLLMMQIPALLMAAVGLWRMARSRTSMLGAPRAEAVALTLGLVVYFWAMTILVLSILRYLVPVMALLMVPIAYLVSDLAARIGGDRVPESLRALLPPKARISK